MLEREIQHARKDDLRVIRLHNWYIPDAVIIDWKRRLVIALEVDIKRTYYNYLKEKDGSKKNHRDEFDLVRLVAVTERPKNSGKNRHYSLETYEKALALREEGYSYNQVGRLLGGIGGSQIYNWVKGKKTPLSVKRKRLLEAANIKVKDVFLDEIREELKV